MSYQWNPTIVQVKELKRIRKHLIEKTLNVATQGKIVEHKGRPGNYYFVMPGVHWPNEAIVPLLENYRIDSGEYVLDFGTGSGVIAIDAAKNATGVTAFDINEDSRTSAKINALIKRQKNVEVWPFAEFNKNSQYDVFTANLPFTDEKSERLEDRAAYDPGLNSHRDLFKCAARHLYPLGRIYLAQANFGAVDQVLDMAESNGYSHKLIGQISGSREVWGNTGAVFYAFEFRRKG
jgi:release factor glutamine methyltransferase